MDLVQLFRALGRRWYATLLGILIVAVAAVGTFRYVPVTYDAKASLLLIPPATTVAPTGANPFLNLGGLSVVAGVLSLSLTDSSTVQKLAPPRSKATYTVGSDPGIPGSVLDIAVSGRSPQQALGILASIESLATTRLAQLQDQVHAPKASQARVMLITRNDKAVPNISSLSRALIVVIAAGLALTFLLTISLDAILRRRAVRKAARKAAHAAAATDDADAPAKKKRAAADKPTKRRTRKERSQDAELPAEPSEAGGTGETGESIEHAETNRDGNTSEPDEPVDTTHESEDDEPVIAYNGRAL